MVEVKFKPADVGTVADGSVTNVKLAPEAVTNDKVANAAAIDSSKLADVPQSKVTNLATDLANKVDGVGTSGDKKVSKIGWISATGEVVIDHEA